MPTPRKNASGTRGKPFAPGNPGKPKGARNRATRALEALLGDNAEAVAKAVIHAATNGDTAAARLVLERVLPARKDSSVSFALPLIASSADVIQASSAVLASVAAGEITPDEAGRVMALLTAHRSIIETVDLERRLTALEDIQHRHR